LLKYYFYVILVEDYLRGVIQLARRKPGEPREKPRYRQQPDPSGHVPLAWIFRKGERIIGRTPPRQFGEYRKLVIADETWFVHCSFAGALDFVFQALGEDNVTIDEDSGEGELIVPEDKKGSWIGSQGSVVGFLKHMFGLNYIQIKGVRNWRKG
jgi:hypothetical protein